MTPASRPSIRSRRSKRRWARFAVGAPRARSVGGRLGRVRSAPGRGIRVREAAAVMVVTVATTTAARSASTHITTAGGRPGAADPEHVVVTLHCAC
jgi:hypothetical protein